MYFWLLAAVVVGLIGWGSMRKGRLYEFPFLAGLLFAGFILFQLLSLRQDITLPEGAYSRVALMAVLCALAVYVGYKLPSRPSSLFRWSYDEERLFYAALGLFGVGAAAQVLLFQLPSSVWQGQASGIVVAILFFADIMDYSFVIAALLFARTGDRRYLLIGLACLFFYYPSITSGVRRAVLAQVILVMSVAVWFGRRKHPPRLLVIPLALVLVLFLTTSIGDLRRAAGTDGLSMESLQSIEWIENVQSSMEPRQDSELKASAYQMAMIDRLNAHDFGLYHWNRMVFRYVPAQLLGRSFKQSLYVRINAEKTRIRASALNEQTFQYYGYEKRPGLTNTGLSDAYGSFWYFGFVKFILIAAIMKVMYVTAMRGSLTHQIFYLALLVPAMHSVSHSTNWFFQSWPHMAAFLLPALLYARARPTDKHPASPSSSKRLSRS